jgi:fatty-acyl-CoA synthase
MGVRTKLLLRAPQVLREYTTLDPDGRTTVADWLERAAREHPERAFLLWNENETELEQTYGELNERANRVAWWALDQGLRSGDTVALLMENRPEYIATWAGLAKAGATIALLNTNLTGDALRHALEAAGARTVVAGSECLDRLASAAALFEEPVDVWVLKQTGYPEEPDALPAGARVLDDDLEDRPTANPDPSVRDELRTGDSLFYIYTSGTTGLPKAARFSHLRFMGVGIATGAAALIEPGHVYYCALPLYHSAGGVMTVSAVLATGATLALRRRFSASAFWDDCRRFGATHFQYIGEFCRYLLNQPERGDDADHAVTTVLGNGLRPDIWQEFQRRFGLERIIEFYGATEGNAAFVNLTGKPGAVGRIPLGAVGRKLGIARIIRYDVENDEHVRNAAGFCIECDPGEPGELIGKISEAGSTGRFEGYTSREATEKKILRDVFESGDAWYRSGDLLRRDRGHWIYFVDRIGDTFRWKGENVSTQEVAETLGALPGLALCNVYGVQVGEIEGRAGMAALQLEGGAERFDPDAFYRFVDAHLPRYAAPVFVRLIAEPEITGTFKLRKVTLQAEGFDPSQIPDPLYFRDDTAGTYVPLTKKLRNAILTSQLRL